MTLLDSEIQTATHKRDGEPVGQFEVRFTDPKAFVEDLKSDHGMNAIEDNIVRLAIVNAPARLETVLGHPVLGGDRILAAYRTKYVEASYQARGQLVKLSCFCGVATVEEATEPRAIALSRATAEALQQATRIVQAALDGMDGVQVRGGGVYVQEGPWTAFPEGDIEALPETRCGVCEALLHLVAGVWRDENGRDETLTLVGRHHNGLPKYQRDHIHRPAEVTP